MGSRRFSLALEHISGDNANKPITAFLVDKNYANYENSNPCLKQDIVTKPLQLRKSRSAPVINNMLELTCRLLSNEEKVYAMVPKRRFSICDLNTFDNELPDIGHNEYYGKTCTASESGTCPSSSISEGSKNLSTGFPKNHCRRNSVAIKFQNPRFIDNSIENEPRDI